jgi:hypothetical protein
MDITRLQEYTSAEKNGLCRIRSANGIRTTVTLRPPLLDVLREVGDDTTTTKEAIDELVHAYSTQMSFFVNLALDEETPTNDIMFAGVRDVTGFKEQAYALNFGWSDMALLRCGTRSYRPQLSTLENTYGLTKDRNVLLVFTPTVKDDPDFFTSPFIELEITNHWFGTGTQSFKFRRADMDKVQQAL